MASSPTRSSSSAYLLQYDKDFNPGNHLVGVTFQSPGYHTKVASGTWVHPVITAFEYALLCLGTREPDRIDRASKIAARLVTFQDMNSTNPTYGIWPYLAEEPISEMSPPDWNWADFCGARIAQMLVEHAEDFDASLTQELKAALGHAALAIFRRNVTPNYTNIAIMGGAVCAAAGEILQDPGMLSYGRQRLQNCVDHTAAHGSFNEYNSPAYTPLALHEAERVLQLVRDPACREAAESLRRTAWQIIAEHFHPGTGQWAGPHARAYSDRLDDDFVAELSEATGVEIAPTHDEAKRLWCGPIDLTLKSLPCPSDLVKHFQKLPQQEVEVMQRFIRREDESLSVYGTTWMVEQACLGSVSRDNLWYQRRPVIGYWKSGAVVPAVLRLQFLCNGVDFCSAYVRSVQQGPRILSAISLIRGLGYNALHMDIPPGGIFEAEDFRVRVHLIADGATADGFELKAGNCSALVHPAASSFGEFPVRWESGGKPGEAWVDGICYEGEKRSFDFDQFGDVLIALGIEMLPFTKQSQNLPQLIGPATFNWEGLSVETSPTPEVYLWA